MTSLIIQVENICMDKSLLIQSMHKYKMLQQAVDFFEVNKSEFQTTGSLWCLRLRQQ